MSEELATYQAAPLAASLFATADAFEQAQRAGKLLAASDLIPKQFQNNIPNCVVAMEMASRIGASPFAVLQNLYVVHGRPAWSAQFLIAMVNSSRRYSPLQFQITTGEQRTIEIQFDRWEGYGDKRTKKTVTQKHTYRDMSCVAYANSLATGERVEGIPVSMDMAIAEGWLAKDGSKWLTMPDVMIRYRAASFFAKLYAPDLTMGMQTMEELNDMPQERNITPAPTMQAGPAIQPATVADAPDAEPLPAKPEPQPDVRAEKLAVVKRTAEICRTYGITPGEMIPGLIGRGIVPKTAKPGDLTGYDLTTQVAIRDAAEAICQDLKDAKGESAP
jgi:hypothetical protein